MTLHATELQNWFQAKPKVCKSENDSILQIQNYSLRIGNQNILNNINLDIKCNQTTAIVGPSGCGKSSLLLSIKGLLSSQSKIQQSGHILLNKNCILENKNISLDFKKRMGFVFQKPQPFLMSIKQNLLLPVQEHFKMTAREQEQVVEEVLKMVGLWNEVKDRLNSSALNLSGGQQQRLCLARSLVLKPEVILMDEPCSSLDPLSSQTIEDLIKTISNFCTIVIVTHNIAQARRISEQMAVFWVTENGGEIVESGATENVFQAPQSNITKLYLSGLKG